MPQHHLRDLIPPLRRYARLMTGDGVVADALLLKLLAEAAPGVRGGTMYRIMLFRALTGALAVHSFTVSPSLASICRAGPRTTPALAAAACDLPFIERAVLGLVAVEGFTPEEASAVLKMPVRLVEGCLEAALDRLSPIPAEMLTARARLG